MDPHSQGLLRGALYLIILHPSYMIEYRVVKSMDKIGTVSVFSVTRSPRSSRGGAPILYDLGASPPLSVN